MAASYLPSVWKNDDKMSGMMSMFKRREVNPQDWDAKMSFWNGLIERSCRDLSDPLVSVSLLKTRFRRLDRVPAGLHTVVEHLLSLKDLRPLDECLKVEEGWLSWGVNSFVTAPVSWLFGAAQPVIDDNQLFVHVETLKEMASKVLMQQTDESVDNGDFLSSVVEYSVLRHRVKDICKSDMAFDLVISQLLRDGAITIGTTSRGEKIVKFRNTKEQGPVRLTETDTNIHGVRRAMTTLEKDISKLEDNVKRYEEEARLYLRKGNKQKAKTLLRQKLLVLKKIKEKDGQYDKLLNIMHRLAQTNDQKDVLDAYKAGVSAFKQNLDRHGLSPDKIDDTMEDINEALSDHEDISMALSQGPSGRLGGSVDSDGELEQELNDLIAGDERDKERQTAMGELPSVPTGDEFEMDRGGREERTGQRDRLQELRRQLEEAR